MWIREMPKNVYEQVSFCHNSVLLWHNDKVYVMDNHLSAAWCWLQSCDSKKIYNFMHIDKHYDMLECFNDEDLQPLRENPHMAYEDYMKIKRKQDNKHNVFRWDNYIMAVYTIQPNWFHTNLFMTHKEGDIGNSWGHKAFSINEKNPLYMDSIIYQYISKPNEILSEFNGNDYKLPWIVNLDLDVFFSTHDTFVQLYSNEFIRSIAKLLNDNLHNIQVLTIALSPDCMGGEILSEKWDNAFRILKIMSNEIDCLKSFPFPKNSY